MILHKNLKSPKYNARKHLVTVVLMTVFCLSCFAQEKPIANLIKQLEQIRVSNKISGTVVLLLDKQNTLINQRLGTSSWQSSQAMSAEQMFRIGSISKSFAALLALRIQQKGLIDLKKSMRHYTKKQHINNSYADTEISLEQLLEHTAGLADLSKAEWDYNDSDPISIEQALALKKGKHKTRWQPGLHSSYSNVGAGMLGLALEKATIKKGDSRSYEQLMDKYVFNPLGMQSSSLLLTQQVKNRLMTGYNTDGRTVIPYWHNIYRPFAAINTDAADMIRFLQMLLNKGMIKDQRFLSAQDIKRMETPQTSLAAQSGLQYGYGLANYSWQFEGYTFHGHGGDADGYLARYGYNHESGLAYFILINAFKHQPLKHMRQLLESYIIKDLPPPQYPQRLQLDANILQQYVGAYTEITSRFGRLAKTSKPTLKIFLKKDKLYIQYKGRSPQVLYAVNQQHFRYFDESVATLAFIKYQGDIYLQGDVGNYVKLLKP